MTEIKKNVIPEEERNLERMYIALRHITQALRQTNLASPNARSVTDPLEEAKRNLLFAIWEKEKE